MGSCIIPLLTASIFSGKLDADSSAENQDEGKGLDDLKKDDKNVKQFLMKAGERLEAGKAIEPMGSTEHPQEVINHLPAMILSNVVKKLLSIEVQSKEEKEETGSSFTVSYIIKI